MASFRRACVLVVEDDEGTREAVAGVLRGVGYEVETAADGVDALERMGKRRPEIVLLDILMPHMDGYELLARMESDPALRSVPVVVMTAACYDSRFANSVAFLRKPIPQDELLARMNDWCQTRPARGRPSG